ncbi:hypothetical protein N7G274_004075 [Stereocaulon virgatum]|uniref:Protein kinase domain-containing protein n=1 Tax=Stereocaulon virgatum TaxID=373712 RepID=A0ABR4AAW2_9LECA
MFRFSRNGESPSCLGSRIVASFFDLPTTDPSETFPNSESRSRAIWKSIARVWEACSRSPLIRRPDVVVDMFPRKSLGEEEQVDFKIMTANVEYDDLMKDLLPLESVFEADADGLPAFPTIDYADLIHAGVPITVGRGESEVVQVPGDRDSSYVFKGVTLASALIDDTTECAKRSCYNEIQTVLDMPPQPNIKGPPEFYVTTTRYEPKRESVVCGTLYPFMKNGSLADAIKEQVKLSTPTWSLHTLAKWCSQLASAVKHSHSEAGTYHIDIKPSNILLDDNEDLIVIDWEQDGATIYVCAPEVNDTMHVREVKDSSGSKTLVYRPFNTLPIPDFGANMKIWNHECPQSN